MDFLHTIPRDVVALIIDECLAFMNQHGLGLASVSELREEVEHLSLVAQLGGEWQSVANGLLRRRMLWVHVVVRSGIISSTLSADDNYPPANCSPTIVISRRPPADPLALALPAPGAAEVTPSSEGIVLALVEGARGQLQSLRLEIKVGMWDFDERGWGRIFQGLRSWREVGIARDEDQRFVELVLDHMPVGSTLEIVNLYVTTYKIFDASGTSTDRRLRSLDDTLADRLADAVSQGRAPRLHQLFVQAPPESERTRTAGRRRGNLSTLETPRRNWPFVEWERVRTFMKTYRDLKLEHEVFVNGRAC